MKAVQQKRKAYVVNMDTDVSREPVSEILIRLLEKVCGKGALLIGNMVSGLIQKSPNDLQISLGVAMRRNKSLTTLFHKFGVCCSYDELALFKYSAAVAVAEEVENVTFCGKKLIHCCADNFDCEIASQNCKKVCHSLAMVLAQTVTTHLDLNENKIQTCPEWSGYFTTVAQESGRKKSRALRIITEEILRKHLQQNPEIKCMDDLFNNLNDLAEKSKTTKLWTEILIKGVFIMTAFVRGAHEQDFPRQLAAMKAMLPYFASAGCHNYLRYGSFYIHHMESLPVKHLKNLKNDGGLRLVPGINN